MAALPARIAFSGLPRPLRQLHAIHCTSMGPASGAAQGKLEGISTRSLAIHFLAAGLLCLTCLPSPALAARFCSVAGTYYCATSHTDDPPTNDNCATSPLDAIIPGANYSYSGLLYTGVEGWNGPTDWTLITSYHVSGDRGKGIKARHIYRRKYTSSIWHPSVVMQAVTVMEYDCKPCKAPFSWDSERQACVTYCPPNSKGFDEQLGLCIPRQQNEPDQCDKFAGNPINIETGEKIQKFRPDVVVGGGPFPIAFSRTYRSRLSPYERQQAR